jgi:hypothetical protein
MKEKIQINVSTFDSGNPEHEKVAQTAMDLASDRVENLMYRKCQACDEKFYVPGRASLERTLGGLAHKVDFVHAMWGMFDDIPEPSLCAEFELESARLNEAKLAAIEFGREYNQKAVHIARSLGHDPCTDYGPQIDEHGSVQIAWLASFREMQDISQIAKLLKAVGAPGLSLTDYGVQLLVYTIDNKGVRVPQIPEFYKEIRRALGRHEPMEFGVQGYADGLIRKENLWVMDLISYGAKEYGTSHTYDEASELLWQN